jgi:phosphatidylglycerol:prolipoprotein diacylglycerol transferase
MLPYFEVPDLPVGAGLTIHPFGLTAVIAGIVGLISVKQLVIERGLQQEIADQCMVCMIVVSLPASCFLDLILNEPSALLEGPARWFMFWKNMSSIGGFCAAAVTAIIFLKMKTSQTLEYIDCFVIALVRAWVPARLGCALVHDHLGEFSNNFFAVNFPGGSRYDMGIIELLFLLCFVALSKFIKVKQWKTGFATAFITVSYGFFRLFADALRTEDADYFGLRSGQWAGMFTIIIGIIVLLHIRKASAQLRKAR